MSKLFLILAIAVSLVALTSGCKSHQGSREYIPGKGWLPN